MIACCIGIEFQQSIYQVIEDIGLDNLALRICFNVSNLNSARNVSLSTSSRTAEGKINIESQMKSSYSEVIILKRIIHVRNWLFIK